jgi:hypothetical protein
MSFMGRGRRLGSPDGKRVRPWTSGDAHESRMRIDTEAWTSAEAFLITTHRSFVGITATLPFMDVYAKALDEAVRAALADGASIYAMKGPCVMHGVEYATPAGAYAAQMFIFANAPPANHAWVRMLQTSPYGLILDWIGSGTETDGISRSIFITAYHVNRVVRQAVADGLVVSPDYAGCRAPTFR